MVPKIALALLLTAALGGCSLNRFIPVGIPCTVGPILLDTGASTRLTRAEKEQIVTVNETGAKLCHWKPPA